MEATIKQITGITFAGKATSNHWVMLDGKKEFGGAEGANSPMELVLIALGGCTGMDVVSILEKMRVQFDRFEIALSSEQAKDYPRVFTRVKIEYHFWGTDIPKDKVEKAIQLSQEKYCSVSAMVKKTARVTTEYVLHPH